MKQNNHSTKPDYIALGARSDAAPAQSPAAPAPLPSTPAHPFQSRPIVADWQQQITRGNLKSSGQIAK